jgi:hypothetical protein
MKKLTLFVMGALMLSLWMATPAAAYAGVQGTARDINNVGWTHGGQVTAYIIVAGVYQACTPVALSGTGTYSIDFAAACGGNLPPIFSTVQVVATFSPGPNGTPADQFGNFFNTSAAGNATVNFNTDTGPTAVTLASLASTNNTSTAVPYLVIAVVALLGSASYIAVRRRSPLN